MYTKIPINAKEENILDLLNKYMKKENNHWYQKDVTIDNISSKIDMLKGKIILRIYHPKRHSFVEKNTLEGLELFLCGL